MDFLHKGLLTAAISTIGAVTMAGCIESPSAAERHEAAVTAKPYESTQLFRPICVDGVQYWDNDGGNGRVVFPRYNANTRKVMTCHGAELP